jgi:hypothetical protein
MIPCTDVEIQKFKDSKIQWLPTEPAVVSIYIIIPRKV